MRIHIKHLIDNKTDLKNAEENVNSFISSRKKKTLLDSHRNEDENITSK